MRILLTLIVAILTSHLYAQQTGELTSRVMFYNVENLFDTKDDTLKNDEEFLPEGERHWDNHKFYQKLNKVAKVIIGVGEWQAPAVVGLCEIENRFVLNQLVFETPLKNYDYSIIHQESPDWRGIDVALLYRKSRFIPDTFFTIQVNFPFDPDSKTRDILYVKGRFITSDTIHVFINHWPSRYGGYLETKPKREFVAGLLRNQADSLFLVNPKSNILIMGDLNDDPHDESVSRILNAMPEPLDSCCQLINLMSGYVTDNSIGTLKYRENWNVFDQVIISRAIYEGENGIQLSDEQAMIYRPPFLIEKDERYMGEKPFRTFKGFEYNGGFSDHLPVFLDLKMSGKYE